MSFFRSEKMALCRLILHQDYAFDCLVALGNLGKAEFVHIYDADSTSNNKFSAEIQRCEEVLRQFKRMQDEINRTGMHTVFYDDADELTPKESDLPEIERAIQQLDNELIMVQSHCDALQNRKFNLFEHQQVLEKVEIFLTRNNDVKITSYDSIMQNIIKDTKDIYDEEGMNRVPMNDDSGTGLLIVTGSIPVERFAAFELMIWRVSRGNALVKYKEFEFTDELIARFPQQRRLKYAFMVASVGETLRQKIIKICQGFQAKVFPCPSTSTERSRVLHKIETELKYLKEIFQKSCEHKKRVLGVASGDLFNWRAVIKKMHQVYFLMNRFGIVHESRQQFVRYLKCDCWIPRSNLREARAALLRGSRVAAGGSYALTFPPLLIERHSTSRNYFKPPTYFVTNKFTRGFQKLIDAYGLASYREINPAPYTIITFPFLFAVMFGDVGHGVLMTLFALALVCREEKIKRNQDESIKSNEIFDILFAGRYIILLMGVFSVYTGLIYNDMLSKPMNIFGSSWHVNFTESSMEKVLYLNPSDPSNYRGTPYIFGVDPVWNSMAENSIIFNNSFKMKVAIILGVIQMMFGLCLSAWNALFFRSRIDFYLVFLPQLVFLTSLFFYLIILVFHKWAYFGGLQVGEYSAGCAPSILITFINMILMKTAEQPRAGCSAVMFDGQLELQKALLFLALLAIPILLCGKPLHFMYQHRRIANISDPDYRDELRHSTMHSLRKSLIYNVKFEETDPHMERHDPEEKLSEIWIHQGIHTIECVLGSVSHTASYLRLWALSLAHSQLSHVLWKMVLAAGLKSNRKYINSIVIYFTFSFFAVLTVAILVVMEGLSAFLHTLRLHWVEFQSKFYGGLGEEFSPFRFEKSKKRDSYV